MFPNKPEYKQHLWHGHKVMGNLKDINYGMGKYLTADDASSVPDIEDNRVNLDTLNFKLASNNSYALYNMKDGFVDAYQDTSGVDASGSTNEIRDSSGKYYSGSQAGNYFGNGELGTVQFGSSSITQSGQSVNIDDKLSTGSASGGPGASSYGGFANPVSPATRDRNVPVPNASACYEATVTSGGSSITSRSGSSNGGSINADGDMVVLQFDTLTVDASTTLTTKHPCRGLFIYVENNCTINGSISMNSRGGKADPTSAGGSDSAAVNANGLQLPMITSGGSSTLSAATFSGTGNAAVAAVANQSGISGDGTVFAIARSGSSGGASATGQGGGNVGSAGTTGAAIISTGGGGSGGTTHDNSVSGNPSTSGAGGTGTCFSGGAGGGGTYNNNVNTPYTGGAGSSTGGAGGPGYGNGTYYAAGGAGNGGGTGVNSSATWHGSDGTGGLIWLVVGGNLTIGSGGSIDVRGQGHNTSNMGGGASGGGAAMILHAGTFTNNGSINTAKAEARSWPSITVDGGAAGTHTAQVSGPPQYLNATLVSNAQTAQAQPDTARITVFEHPSTGTTTVNTDIKAYASRDNGTTYTQITLADDGEYESGKKLLSGSADISGQPAGTSMRYKIETLNQSSSKITRLHGVSLQWA